MLTICKEGGKIHWVRKRCCEPVRQNFPSLPDSWAIFKVHDRFVWSPMEGCEGLIFENPVISKPCGSRAGWSSDEEMDDATSLDTASDTGSGYSLRRYDNARTGSPEESDDQDSWRRASRFIENF